MSDTENTTTNPTGAYPAAGFQDTPGHSHDLHTETSQTLQEPAERGDRIAQLSAEAKKYRVRAREAEGRLSEAEAKLSDMNRQLEESRRQQAEAKAEYDAKTLTLRRQVAAQTLRAIGSHGHLQWIPADATIDGKAMDDIINRLDDVIMETYRRSREGKEVEGLACGLDRLYGANMVKGTQAGDTLDERECMRFLSMLARQRPYILVRPKPSVQPPDITARQYVERPAHSGIQDVLAGGHGQYW